MRHKYRRMNTQGKMFYVITYSLIIHSLTHKHLLIKQHFWRTAWRSVVWPIYKTVPYHSALTHFSQFSGGNQAVCYCCSKFLQMLQLEDSNLCPSNLCLERKVCALSDRPKSSKFRPRSLPSGSLCISSLSPDLHFPPCELKPWRQETRGRALAVTAS